MLDTGGIIDVKYNVYSAFLYEQRHPCKRVALLFFILTHPEELQCLIAHTPHPFRHLPNLREQPHPACSDADNQRGTIRRGAVLLK